MCAMRGRCAFGGMSLGGCSARSEQLNSLANERFVESVRVQSLANFALLSAVALQKKEDVLRRSPYCRYRRSSRQKKNCAGRAQYTMSAIAGDEEGLGTQGTAQMI